MCVLVLIPISSPSSMKCAMIPNYNNLPFAFFCSQIFTVVFGSIHTLNMGMKDILLLIYSVSGHLFQVYMQCPSPRELHVIAVLVLRKSKDIDSQSYAPFCNS